MYSLLFLRAGDDYILGLWVIDCRKHLIEGDHEIGRTHESGLWSNDFRFLIPNSIRSCDILAEQTD